MFAVARGPLPRLVTEPQELFTRGGSRQTVIGLCRIVLLIGATPIHSLRPIFFGVISEARGTMLTSVGTGRSSGS